MTDGIKIDGLETFAEFTTNGLRFHFIRGGLQSLPTYRGQDDTVPGASGLYAGQWTKGEREVALHGFVAGDGATDQEVRESFRTRAAALLAKMDVATLVDIVAYPPFFGLAVGEIATLSNVRPLRVVGPDPSDLWYEGWEVTLELVCIDSPPDWVIGP